MNLLESYDILETVLVVNFDHKIKYIKLLTFRK